MKKRRIRDYSTDYTYGYTTGYLGMWLMPTKGGERTSPEDEGEDAEDGLHRGQGQWENNGTEIRIAESYEIRHARYATDTPRQIHRWYATPDTPQRGPTAKVFVWNNWRIVSKWRTGNDSLFMFVVPILIPMVRCCIYISHSFTCGSFVLFVLFCILTLCAPV